MPKISDDRRALRRQQILDGARRCFSRSSYERTTVRHLEAEIGLSSGAIFNYFESKLGLFIGLAAEDARTLAAAWTAGGMRATVDAASRGALSAAYLELGRQVWSDPDFRAAWADRGAPLEVAIRTTLTDDMDANRTRPGVPLDALVDYTNLVLDGLLLRVRVAQPLENIDHVLKLYNDAIYSN